MKQICRLMDGNTLLLKRKEGHQLITFNCCGGLRVEVDADALYCWTPSAMGLSSLLKIWWHHFRNRKEKFNG